MAKTKLGWALFAVISLGWTSCTSVSLVGEDDALSGKPNPFATDDIGGGFPTTVDVGAGTSDTTTAAVDTQPPDTHEPTEIPADAGVEEESDTPPYECVPFSVEECQTPCGTWGLRKCIKTWTECEPPDEVCNLKDDDCDGEIDEGVANACGGCGPVPLEECNGLDDDCDGTIDEGVSNACGGCGPVPEEVCNGVDDNCDGQIDEGVSNACGECGELSEELCNGIDDDCDGEVDESCVCHIDVEIDGDCVFVKCPDKCPYPVACDINMVGGDDRGCVASLPMDSHVYLQEGNNCGAGSMTGTLTCSSEPGQELDQQTCPINKPKTFHVPNPAFCP